MRERARLASVGLLHAGDWLNVVPSPSLGLRLRGPEFIAAVKYRGGAEIFTRAGPCPACCRHSDVLGDHALCCGQQGERIARHNHLQDALFLATQSATLGPTKEGRFLLPGTDRRPADGLIPHWGGGRDAALDLTVIKPLQAATVVKASATPGSALQVAFDHKVAGVGEACRRQGLAFLPLAMDSQGGWRKVAEGEVRKLGSAVGRQKGQEESEATSQLLQKFSVLLMKGNCGMLLNSSPADGE